MTRSQKNAWLWVIAIILLLIIFSCKTRKEVVTETIHTHDTLLVYKTDTFVDVKIKEVFDTVRQVEKHVITLNNVGDTIKEVHHYHDIMRTMIVDSTNRYEAKVDSLQRLVEKMKNTEKIVKKNIAIPWWAWITTPLILLVGGGFFVRKMLDRKWHIT